MEREVNLTLQMEEVREGRVRHLLELAQSQLARKAVRRGWLAWRSRYGWWKRRAQLLQGRGGRVLRPVLIWGWRAWKEGWGEEERRRVSRELMRQLKEGEERRQVLEGEVEKAREQVRRVQEEKETERREKDPDVRGGGSGGRAEEWGEWEEEMRKTREGKEDEGRLARLERVAAGRLARMRVVRAWRMWWVAGEEGRVVGRMLRRDVRRLAMPRLRACLHVWVSSWEGEVSGEERRRLVERLRVQAEECDVLRAEVRSLTLLLREEGEGREEERQAASTALAAALREEREGWEGWAERMREAVERRRVRSEMVRAWDKWREGSFWRRRGMRLLGRAAACLSKPRLLASYKLWHFRSSALSLPRTTTPSQSLLV